MIVNVSKRLSCYAFWLFLDYQSQEVPSLRCLELTSIVYILIMNNLWHFIWKRLLPLKKQPLQNTTH